MKELQSSDLITGKALRPARMRRRDKVILYTLIVPFILAVLLIALRLVLKPGERFTDIVQLLLIIDLMYLLPAVFVFRILAAISWIGPLRRFIHKRRRVPTGPAAENP